MDKNTKTNILREFQDVQRHMNIHMRCVNTKNCLKNPGSATRRRGVLLLVFSAAIVEAFEENREEPA